MAFLRGGAFLAGLRPPGFLPLLLTPDLTLVAFVGFFFVLATSINHKVLKLTLYGPFSRVISSCFSLS